MTPRQADKAIKAGMAITVRSQFYGNVFSITPVSRDRWNIYGSNGEKVDRGDLIIIEAVGTGTK